MVEGGDGQDAVKLSHGLSAYRISQETDEDGDATNSTGKLEVTLFGPDGMLVVRDIKILQLTDTQLVLFDAPSIASLDQLYEDVFGRMPDLEGLSFWATQLAAGASLEVVAQAMTESTEFVQRYGSAPSNDQLVQELYEGILNRAPDPEGLAFWSEGLETISRGELIVELLHSFEAGPITQAPLFTLGEI